MQLIVAMRIKKMTETIMVRVPVELLNKFREQHSELKGLTWTAVVEVMLRKAMEA